VILIVRPLHTPHELRSVLHQPTAEMQALRAMLTVAGRYPSRWTWHRRLRALPRTLPAQIGCLGRWLVVLWQPWPIRRQVQRDLGPAAAGASFSAKVAARQSLTPLDRFVPRGHGSAVGGERERPAHTTARANALFCAGFLASFQGDHAVARAPTGR
jgi:hypothetical protein